MASLRDEKKSPAPARIRVPGSFSSFIVGDTAQLVVTVAAGESAVLYADVDGAQGDGLLAVATADGLAKALLDLGTVTTNIDTIIEATTGGVAGNGITVSFSPTNTAGNVVITVDATSNHVFIEYQPAVSTVGDLETAVGALAGADDIIAVKTTGTGANVLATTDSLVAESLVGGTAETYVEWGTSPSKLAIHFTGTASSTSDVAGAVNAAHADKVMSMLVHTGTDVWAAGDAFTVDALTSANRLRTQGKGFSVTHTDIGLFTITFDYFFKGLDDILLDLQLATGAALDVIVGPVDLVARTAQVFVQAKTGGALTDFASGDNNKVHFVALFKNRN